MRTGIFIWLLLCAPGIAWGHGIGSETLPAQTVNGEPVHIQIDAGGLDGGQLFTFAALGGQEAVRNTVLDVTAYRQDAKLFQEEFDVSTGILALEIVPKEAFVIEGQGLFGLFASDNRVKIGGPQFGAGGLYKFDLVLRKADGRAVEPPVVWQAGISIQDETIHGVEDEIFGSFDIRHISYYDVIDRFWYGNGSVSFTMPVDGDFESLNQTSVIHEEIAFPKNFGRLMSAAMDVRVDNMPMPDRAIQIDDFNRDNRTVHIVLDQSIIMELYEGGLLDDDLLSFEIAPTGKILGTATNNGQFRVEIEPQFDKAEIRYRILDAFLKDRPAAVPFEMSVWLDGAVLAGVRGTSADMDGFEAVGFEMPAGAAGIMEVRFENLGGNALASAVLPIAIPNATKQNGDGSAVPAWIKNVAESWSQSVISDAEFVAAIQYLAQNQIIAVSSVVGSDGSVVPAWIKNVAGLWSQSVISDTEFLSAVEYLVKVGIIRL